VPELFAAGAGGKDGSALPVASAVAVLDRLGDGEGHAAVNANLVDGGNGAIPLDAFAGAVAAWEGLSGHEGVPASFASNFYAGEGDLAASGVGVLPLVQPVAGAGAELGVSLSDPRGWHVEGGFAVLASPLHVVPVSRVDTHSNLLTVYNIEVEGDHSYVANGFAVHNCTACWAMHGETFDNSVPGPDGHPNCRCARVPVVRRDLRGDFPDGPTKDELWGRLSEDQKLRVLGPTRYDLTGGGPPPPSFATQVPAGEWRSYRVATPVRDLVGA
jgi:hypothetical protein